MNYQLVITFTSGQQLHREVDVTAKDGYYRTNETGSFLEVSTERGLVEVFPLANIVQIVVEDKAP